MISTILLCDEKRIPSNLENQIQSYCPQVKIQGKANCFSIAHQLIVQENPNLLFIDLHSLNPEGINFLQNILPFNCEVILISKTKDFVPEAIRLCAAGYLHEPVQREELVIAVQNASERIKLKEENKRNKFLIRQMMGKMSENDLIGVSTMDGFDFFPAGDIYRCEGLQKCTRIITKHRSNIISAYNLGEYKKLLKPYGFFSPHKSHLINLKYVKQYKREGSIIMTDGSVIPVSRRKKSEFLDWIVHV